MRGKGHHSYNRTREEKKKKKLISEYVRINSCKRQKIARLLHISSSVIGKVKWTVSFNIFTSY